MSTQEAQGRMTKGFGQVDPLHPTGIVLWKIPYTLSSSFVPTVASSRKSRRGSFLCRLDLLAVGLARLEVAPLGGVAGELESRHTVGATHLGDG